MTQHRRRPYLCSELNFLVIHTLFISSFLKFLLLPLAESGRPFVDSAFFVPCPRKNIFPKTLAENIHCFISLPPIIRKESAKKVNTPPHRRGLFFFFSFFFEQIRPINIYIYIIFI